MTICIAACSPSGEPRGEPIACAIGHAGALAEQCRLERTVHGESAQFIAHHPDGGFRRFELASGGEGLVPADGADAASSKAVRDAIEVTIGQDRYRIPQSLLEP